MFDRNNYMTQWLIGIFVRFLSSKDNLINCAGARRRTNLEINLFCLAPFFLYISNFFSTLFLSKTLSSKKRKKNCSNSLHWGFHCVKLLWCCEKQLLALMQEVATRSVALPRNARRFSCGASLLS